MLGFFLIIITICIRELIYKGFYVIITQRPLRISLEFHIALYANIRACIKFIGNHAEKMSFN